MNFIKGSLFRRNTEPEELEPVVESGGGVLAVWGSPGCGKTVTAVKIAKHLASQKKNVALLLCDMTAPMMPCICPPSELECDKSLGSIFAAQRISVNLIKHNLTTHKKLSYLTMLGLRKGENEYTYAACTKQQAEELIRGLREIAPYVVIDCSSYIANDILSAVALMEADSVLRLANCDLKSIGYLSSQLPLLRELHWDEDKQYKAASNIKPLQAADRIGQVLGSVAFQLPHSQELEEQYHTSIVLITHDMGVVATVCQRVAIMYGGLIMETGTSDEIFYDPKHPYTKALLRAIPSTELKEGERLQAIEGLPPSLVNPPAGCPFAERCEYASERCAQQLPEYYEFSGTHRAMCHLYDQAQTNGKEAAK